MANYDYYDEIGALLKQVPQIKKTDIYNYIDSPSMQEFEDLYQFAQENLRNYCDEYEIQPSYFHYVDKLSVNARAGKFNSHYIIGINKGTIVELHKLFIQNNIFNKNENLKQYLVLENILDVPISVLMYQLATQFTFYHELGHLIQKSTSLFQGMSEEYQKPFSLEKHLLEFDSDLHAANHIAFHVRQYLDKIDNSNKTKENIEKLISTSIASIYCYFTLLFQSFNENIYYLENTHPHPIIRISYILPTFIDVLAKHFSINQANVLNEGLMISKEIFIKSHQGELIGSYENILFTELENIQQYIKKMVDGADKLPFLAVNKVHKKYVNNI